MCNRHCSKCGVQIALVQLTWTDMYHPFCSERFSATIEKFREISNPSSALTLVRLDDGPLVALLPEHDIAEVQDAGDDLQDFALLLSAHVHGRHRFHHLHVVSVVIRVIHLRYQMNLLFM